MKVEPPPTTVRLLLTIPEAARTLGVGRSFVYELLMTGEIASIKIGRSRRVLVTSLHTFISRQVCSQDQDIVQEAV